ncbi:hypothetical protein [Permianibacter aggregans]|uniref:Matrixin n=1 Tax=Permianibacter aggregans TaxID=1510150 RepID=A0A4R6URV2_9GAMM|nr:hypothetical protein [Permianibacter aggregans]QGX39236.1 hypothetical protein E2H98_06035 [Permianibacter aggregans]TDQ46044.1 hypothetical protein EV696_11538 [Permianibacter aggregans]
MNRWQWFSVSMIVWGSMSSANADHAWGNYHWERSSNPITIGLGDNVDSRWQASLDGAANDWSASRVINTPVVAGTVSNPKRCRASTGKVEVCNDTYGNNGWLGIASIAINGGHITSGVVKVNDTYYNSPTYDTPAWRNSVMCQEIGHILGLDHNDEDFNTTTGTCMDYSNNPEPNQHPDQHDYQMLEQIYQHLDDEGGGGNPCKGKKCQSGMSAEDFFNNIDMNGPENWGRLLAARGGKAVYELNFGQGRRILTVVTWTLERAREHQH